jgi:hypothetical protein
MKQAWLELFDWEFVTTTNAALCQPKTRRFTTPPLMAMTGAVNFGTRTILGRVFRSNHAIREATELFGTKPSSAFFAPAWISRLCAASGAA